MKSRLLLLHYWTLQNYSTAKRNKGEKKTPQNIFIRSNRNLECHIVIILLSNLYSSGTHAERCTCKITTSARIFLTSKMMCFHQHWKVVWQVLTKISKTCTGHGKREKQRFILTWGWWLHPGKILILYLSPGKKNYFKGSLCCVGLFFFSKRNKMHFFATNRCPYFSQSSLTALPVHVAVFSSPSSPGSPQKSMPWMLLQTWEPPAIIISTQRSQGGTRPPPSSQPLTCPCKVQGSGSLSLFSLLSPSQQPCSALFPSP